MKLIRVKVTKCDGTLNADSKIGQVEYSKSPAGQFKYTVRQRISNGIFIGLGTNISGAGIVYWPETKAWVYFDEATAKKLAPAYNGFVQ